MRYIVILILLSGCSASWHAQRAIKKGAKFTTETKIEYDTIEIPSVKDSLIYVPDVDTIKVKANCDSLLNGNQSAIKNIQKEVCPQIEQSVTIKIPVTVNDSIYYIDAVLVLSADGGNLSAYLFNEPKKLTYEKKVTNNSTITAKPKKPWYIPVLYVLSGIGLLTIVLVIRKRL